MNGKNCGNKNPMFGKHHTEESKLKISKAVTGKQAKHNSNKSHPHTEEWKKQHSANMMGCNNPAFGKNLPEERKEKIAKSLLGKYYGEKSANWAGGRNINYKGYVLISNYNHPYKNKHGDVLEHRLIMEQYLGRYLTPEEEVHHINGIKDDNRIENLMLFPNKSDHMRFHANLKKLKKESE
jgi:hypothetical protein